MLDDLGRKNQKRGLTTNFRSRSRQHYVLVHVVSHEGELGIFVSEIIFTSKFATSIIILCYYSVVKQNEFLYPSCKVHPRLVSLSSKRSHCVPASRALMGSRMIHCKALTRD